jgi:glucosamine-6-phosphate deaminase
MRVLTLADAAAVAAACADIVADEAARKADLVLGLPTGRTVLPVYEELAARHARGGLDLARCRAFNLDELLLPRHHPATFRAYMDRHAGRRIGLDPNRCDMPSSIVTGEQVQAECERYEAAIAASGGFDLALLGVGADGHVAYNLPGEPRFETHAVELDAPLAETLAVPAAFQPLRAITVGLGVLRAAGRLVLMATTAGKAAAVRALVSGPSDQPNWPCSYLRAHHEFDLLLTPAAAP